MAYLKHLSNGETIAVYHLKDNTVIGRHTTCQIVVDDPTVSAQHAEVRCVEGGAVIQDLDSTNGVRIGRKRVTEHVLKGGDVFVLGTHEFEFCNAMPTDLDQTLKIKKAGFLVSITLINSLLTLLGRGVYCQVKTVDVKWGVFLQSLLEHVTFAR